MIILRKLERYAMIDEFTFPICLSKPAALIKKVFRLYQNHFR